LLLLLVVIGLPSLVGQHGLTKRHFDSLPVRLLEKNRPDCVMIGDSMLETRIDPAILKQQTALRCQILTYPGSGSAQWYLVLQNVIAVQSRPPRWLIIFFRDRQLTLAAYHTDGRYRPRLEASMQADEPLVEKVLTGAKKASPGWLDRLSLTLYPLQRHSLEWQTKVLQTALDFVTKGDRSKVDHIRRAADELFDTKHLRSDTGAFVEDEDDYMTGLNPNGHDFGSCVQQSFLPQILRLARETGIRPIFFRVKSKPPNDPAREPEDLGLSTYIHELGAYLQENGALLVDESRDPAITADYYGADDHVVDAMTGRYTQQFWQKMRPLLSDGPR
jgi:hypothetical protein